MSGIELFHTIADRDCADVRRRIVDRGLKERIDFRNVHFDEHRDALAERGGSRTPALWDGERLHEGLVAALAAIERL